MLIRIFVFLIFFIALSKCNDFIPPESPLARSYTRHLHPFHPIHAAPFLVTRAPDTVIMYQPQQKMNLLDDTIVETNENRIFESTRYWDVNDKPVLANGHIGFVPYGDSIYMNGLFNGYKGSSHRARIPNYANIQFEPCTESLSTTDSNKLQCSYALDVFDALFRTRANFNNGSYSVEQIQYAHRYHEAVIVNRIQLRRQNSNDTNESFRIRLHQVWGNESEDLTIKNTKSINIMNRSVVVVSALTKILEDPVYQTEFASVAILYERIPETIELLAHQSIAEFTWITVIQSNVDGIEDTFRQIHENEINLLKQHTDEWRSFWQSSAITVEGNAELSKSIQASLFAIASSLPSLNTSRKRTMFYGLSPSGLGLGGPKLEGYQGHNFWDTETWMHPAILLLNPTWSKELLNYRHFMRHAAQDNAKNTGYKGFRYPWESAYTGRDVTLAEYPEIVEFQQHITADIGHALRQHFFATHDLEWFRSVGSDLAYGTAQFWESRVTYNTSTKRFDINGIMGPDEDHYNISNNAYTNVAAALNLHFGSYASCVCHKLDPIKYPLNTNWSTIASRITLPYDPQLDYNPQYDGYNLSVGIKQADVVLLGYPLQYANIRPSTRKNNLNLYANVTRTNGPAMTWSMHAIGHLDADSTPPSEELFNRTYVPYIREPYFVWNEYVKGVEKGASNFITGAGGFLQLIMYGYAGIRINADSMTITNPMLPPNTTKLKLNGISYMQSRYSLEIMGDTFRLFFQAKQQNVRVFIDGIEQDIIKTNNFLLNRAQKFIIKPKRMAYLDSCPLPEDTIDLSI